MSAETDTNPGPPDITGWGPLFLALAIGTVGGTLFSAVSMPLPWMMGSMFFTTVAAIIGVRIRMPIIARHVMIGVLGLLLGSSLKPEKLAQATQWPITIGIMVLYLIVVGGAAYLYLRRDKSYNPVTSYFAAAPGGLTEMTLMSHMMGGDDRIVSLTHSVRIFTVVLLLPLYFRIFEGYEPIPFRALKEPMATPMTPEDVIVMALCGVLGFFIGKKLKIPAYPLAGPLLLAGAAQLSGLTQAEPPNILVAVAQVFIGTTIGARFVGTSARHAFKVMGRGSIATVIMLAGTALFALGVTFVTDIPVIDVLLGFAPGGLTEMALVTLAMEADVAFVSSHHFVRILLITLAAPFLFKFFRSRLQPPEKEETPEKALRNP